MNEYTMPPPILEGARLLEYAIVDETVSYAGNSRLYVDGKLLGAVPRLAICQEESGRVLLLFFDDLWNGLGVVEVVSVAEAKFRAESAYFGLSTKWVVGDVSDEQALRFLADQSEGQQCSFCGNCPRDVEQTFETSAARICDNCVRDFGKELNATH